ncbi:MAG: anti-sigma factor [Methylobacteriaceae bacterium]|nr:anti-sigma factor [Methylobacteriaceae bacterium]
MSERDSLAAEYALGALEGADLARAERLERDDAAFRAAVARWRADLCALDDAATPAAPSPDLWTRIEAQSHAARAGAPTPARAPRAALWESLAFWRNAGLAAALASLVLAVGLVAALNRAAPSPVYVAVLNAPDGRAAAVVNVHADGAVELIPLEDIAVPQGRIIEVWTLQDRAQGPVSVGRMDRARRLKLDLKTLRAPDVNHLFELTLEPPGGSPTGKPTGPVLMKGLAAKSV